MIFAIWYAGWVMLATSSIALAYPGIALVIRASYLNRILFRLSYLLLATVIFLWLFLWPTITWQKALLTSLQVFAFLCLTLHLIAGASEMKMRILPANVVMVKHLIARYLRIVNERLDDIRYACGSRSDSAYKIGLWRPRTVKAFGTSIISECLVLVNHISMIIISRGDANLKVHPSTWQSESRTRSRYFMGDIALVVLVVFLSFVGADRAMPESIVKYVQAAKSNIEQLMNGSTDRSVLPDPPN